MHDVLDIYPLSPLQQGFLFHSLLAPDAGEHLLQITCTLHGPLDVARFHAACARVVASHPALHTSFAWDGLDEPLQVVRRPVTPELVQLDWRDQDPAARQAALAGFLAEDRRRGFALDRPPLMRWALARTGPEQHVLVWTCHHLLVDGWSLSLVLRQCVAAYEAAGRGEAPAPVVVRPYRDYIAWLKRQPIEPSERYWRGRLRGLRAATPLPLARPRPGAAGTPRGSLRRVLGGGSPGGGSPGAHGLAFDARLAAFTRAHAITPSAFFQAIWALLLARYTGERDVVFGTVVAGRPADLPGVEDMVGMFVNSIPVRAAVAPELPVAEWMRRLQREAAEAREFEHASLTQIHGWSELGRGEPLFETLLVYESFPAIEAAGRGELAARDAETHDVTSFALDVAIIPGPPYTVLATYARDRYDEATVARILDHLEHAAAQILARPEARVADVSILPEGEARLLLETWNARRADYPVTRSIPALVEEAARRAPERVAAAHRDARLTYAELDAAGSRVAHALIERGAGTDAIVALLVDRDLSLPTSILGILKAGGAYLPLDVNHPPERIAQILAQARPRLAVAGGAHEALLAAAIDRLAPGARPPLVRLDALLAEPPRAAPPPLPPPPPALGGRSLAYVIFTSGSTGAPKGAMLSHGGKINHMLAMLERLELGAEDVIAQTVSPCFDVSVWQLLAPLLIGARVEIFDPELLRDPAAFLAHLARTGATVVEAVPSVVASLLDELERLGDRRPALSALRWVIPTAEAVPPALYRRWLRLYPHHRMANAYGPTEAHDVTNLFVLDGPPGDADERVPIGPGLPNVRLYICDDELAPVPIGVAGELCIGGHAVGRGYVGDPARTAAAFLPDPFAGVPGARLYRTGDRCRYREDGSIEFLERCDFQIKIHGHRIEPGDIEGAISRHPGVRQCVVVASGPDRDRLVAYVVSGGVALAAPCTVRPRAGGAPAGAGDPAGDPEALAAALATAVHADLQQLLPRYMVPSTYVLLSSLPLNANGKLDRRALPPPAADARPRSEAAASRTPVEAAIAQIWEAVLDRAVDIDDDFFELGGHSLAVIRVQSRLREAFQIELPLRTLFELPTVRQLAAKIEAIRWATGPGASGAEGDEDVEI